MASFTHPRIHWKQWMELNLTRPAQWKHAASLHRTPVSRRSTTEIVVVGKTKSTYKIACDLCKAPDTCLQQPQSALSPPIPRAQCPIPGARWRLYVPSVPPRLPDRCQSLRTSGVPCEAVLRPQLLENPHTSSLASQNTVTLRMPSHERSAAPDD